MLDFVQQRKNVKNLVIFIHGLNGSQETWVNTSHKSFPDMLHEDRDVKSKFDMAYFEYYTSMLPSSIAVKEVIGGIKNFLGLKPKKVEVNLDVPTISNLLLTQLETHASNYKNIFIVAHSMGGLVAKSLIANHPDKEIVRKIKLVVSLAVPHNGSNLAIISRVYPLLQIKNLAPLDEAINKVNQAWIDAKETNPRIVYFQGSYDEIVKGASSVGYDANKLDIKYCGNTHTDISKPESVDSTVYVSVKNILLEIDHNDEIKEELSILHKPDLTEVENEDFVIKLIIADVNDRMIKNAKIRFFEAEMTRKVLYQIGMKEDVEELYRAIEQIYHNSFGDLIVGKISDGDALVNHVHNKITDEHERLLKSISKISFMHKIGMMHQIANIDDEIWWARNHSVSDIEDYKRRRSQAE